MFDPLRYWDERGRAHASSAGGWKAVCCLGATEIQNRLLHRLQEHALRRAIRRDPGMTVLEFGGGVGRWLEEFGPDLKMTVGVDISPVMIEEARRRLSTQARTFLCRFDGSRLPFRDGSFDLAFSVTVLIHIVDAEMLARAVREICRVTRTSGRIVILEGFAPNDAGGPEHLRFRPEEYYAELFREAGWRLRSSRTVYRWAPERYLAGRRVAAGLRYPALLFLNLLAQRLRIEGKPPTQKIQEYVHGGNSLPRGIPALESIDRANGRPPPRSPCSLPSPAEPHHLWDKYGRERSSWRQHTLFLHHQLGEKAVAALLQGKDREISVLDAGCGDGYFLDLLSRLGFRRVIGIDPSRPMIERCLERGLPARRGTLNEMDAAAAFDLILLVQVLEHLEDPEAALRQARFLLKDGGEVLIAVPVCDSLLKRYHRFRYGTEKITQVRDWDDTHRHAFSEKELLRLLRSLSFRIITSRQVSNPFPWAERYGGKKLGELFQRLDFFGRFGDILIVLAGKSKLTTKNTKA